jgi:signal transduction histidine kinase
VPAIQGLQQELSRADVVVTFTHENVPSNLPLDLTLSLFRVVQEGLQNALKYSGAKHVSVELAGGAEWVSLMIIDDGVGFDVKAAWGKGLGLISIGERLEPIGGSFEVRSAPGQGTHLVVRVPLLSLCDRGSDPITDDRRRLARADSA